MVVDGEQPELFCEMQLFNSVAHNFVLWPQRPGAVSWKSSLQNTILFLQGNMITGFYSNAFANTTNLRWLILDQNQLLNERLDGGSLFNLTQLVYLFMNHNNLTEVPARLPGGLKQLRLAYNQIEKIGPGAFENLQNLTMLLLQGNRLKTIEEADFKGMTLNRKFFIVLIWNLSHPFYHLGHIYNNYP